MSGPPIPTETLALDADPVWLDRHHEEILDPELPIIDPHHHLWDKAGGYYVNDMLADVSEGHNVLATVYIECESCYDTGLDSAMAPIGETEFAIAQQRQSPKHPQFIAGIVGYADLTLGADVAHVLDAHQAIAGDRFKGIRTRAVWDGDPSVSLPAYSAPQRLLLDCRFREGFACLEPAGLSFDGWLYHPQIPDFIDLANAFPGTQMILNHCGSPLFLGPYSRDKREVFDQWRRQMEALARCPNVVIKLGGFGTRFFDFGFHASLMQNPPSSDIMAEAIRPFVEVLIELFGTERCMFESNFPVDKRSVSYVVLWNAFKRVTVGASASEKSNLFFDTAKRTYRLTGIDQDMR